MSDLAAASARPILALSSWSSLYTGLGALAVFGLKEPHSSTLLNAITSLVFLHAGFLAVRRKESLAWRWIGSGFMLFSLCQMAPAATALLRGTPPDFPGWPDWMAMASLILVGTGVVQWPRSRSSLGEKLRLGLDATGTGLAVLFLGWALVLRGLFATSALTWPPKVATLLFVVLNTAGLVLVLIVGAPRPKGPLRWMGVAMALSILQVLVCLPLQLEGRYAMGHPLDLLVLLVGVCMFIAANQPMTGAPSAPSPTRNPRWSILAPILPVSLCLALFTGLAVAAPHRLDRPLLLLGVALVALVLWREFLALRDFQRLSDDLEKRVHERTEALNAAQGLLLRTERMNTVACLGAGMAHDMKNLVGAVRNYALLMEMDLKEGRPLNPEDLESLRMGADQAGDLAHRLMAFGREENRADTFYDINDILRRLISLLRATVPTQVALRFVPSESALPLVGDPRHIEQLLVNLVLNARDAIPGSGTIGVELALEKDSQRGGLARLVVWDTGQGMSPEVLAKAFDPFYTTKAQTGTGLGLSSVRNIVEELAGEVSVESKEGEGTRFTVRIPLAAR